jgi:predicted HD superfamily hydrolase involved in NAD metabolism
MNYELDRYSSFVEGLLSPRRYQHSLRVMQCMAELAKIYSLDRDQAMVTGLLHDAARDMSDVQLLAMAQEAGIELSDPCERHPVYLHAPVGAYLVSRELNITDDRVLDAITAHSHASHGRYFDAPLSRCLRFADVLEPGREWPGSNALRNMVYGGRDEEAALLLCGWLIEFFQEQCIPVHPNLLKHFHELSDKLAVNESFFERW